MDCKRKADIYNKMYLKIPSLEQQIRTHLVKLGLKIYTVYLTVGSEETEEYFVDIEFGGSSTTYRRYRGLYSEEKLIKLFHLEREMTREEFTNTGWECSYEEYLAFQCDNCDRTDCIHRNAFRRVPKIDGGLGLCPNLKNHTQGLT